MSGDYQETMAEIERLNPWFATYEFPNGAKTQSLRGDIKKFFQRRTERVFTLIERFVDPQETTLLDIGCADGYFSNVAASRGYKHVTGIDFREAHVERANLAKKLFGHSNVEFRQGSVYDLTEEGVEPHDVVLFQGLLYHLANPVAAARQVRALTKKMAYYGSWTHGGVPGVRFSLQAESSDYIQGNEDLSMVPTQQGFYAAAVFVGFPGYFEYDLSHDPDCKWGTDLEWREMLAVTDAHIAERDSSACVGEHNTQLVWKRQGGLGPFTSKLIPPRRPIFGILDRMRSK